MLSVYRKCSMNMNQETDGERLYCTVQELSLLVDTRNAHIEKTLSHRIMNCQSKRVMPITSAGVLRREMFV